MTTESHSSGPTTDHGFLRELWEHVRLFDIGLIAAVPTILVTLFQLSRSTRRSLAFSPDTPTILTAFTTHFIHLGSAHLIGNLWLYALIVPMIFLLLSLCGCRKDFLIVSTSILVAFPFILSGLNLLLLRQNVIIVGFSGLAMAFVGVLPVALFRFLDERVPREIDLDDAPGLFFIGAGLIALRMAPTELSYAIVGATGLIALWYSWRLARSIAPIKRTDLERTSQLTGYVELSLTAPILFVVSILMAFPADTVGLGGVIDLYTHLLGYTLGFIASYLTLRITQLFPDDEPPEPPDFIDDPEVLDSPD